ncbi:MAG: hypothetical protein ACFFD1_13750 [Candidatus Thorarchaeota archaeon]
MKAIADLQKLINENKNILVDDNDIVDWYNILDIEIKKLKPRESAFSIILKGYIILIFVLLISANGILITLFNLFRIGNEFLSAIILSVLFWTGIVIAYFKLEEPLSFIKQSLNKKLSEIKNELSSYIILQMKIIEQILERNLMFKSLEKIKREKNKIEKYLKKVSN